MFVSQCVAVKKDLPCVTNVQISPFLHEGNLFSFDHNYVGSTEGKRVNADQRDKAVLEFSSC